MKVAQLVWPLDSACCPPFDELQSLANPPVARRWLAGQGSAQDLQGQPRRLVDDDVLPAFGTLSRDPNAVRTARSHSEARIAIWEPLAGIESTCLPADERQLAPFQFYQTCIGYELPASFAIKEVADDDIADALVLPQYVGAYPSGPPPGVGAGLAGAFLSRYFVWLGGFVGREFG